MRRGSTSRESDHRPAGANCGNALGRLSLAGCLGLGLLSGVAAAAEESGGGGDLRAATQNPISSLISLPLKLTVDQGAKNGDAQILNVNPVVPVTVGDWNLVNRALIPIASVDGAIPCPDNPMSP